MNPTPMNPTQMGQHLNQLFLKGRAPVTQMPGAAHSSTRRFYKTHAGYDFGTQAGTSITPSFSGEVMGTSMDTTGFGLRQLVRDDQSGQSYYLSHLSKPIISRGKFKAGQPISYTGGTPGSYGAGNTTGAHLDITQAFGNIIRGIKNLTSPTSASTRSTAPQRPRADLVQMFQSAVNKFPGKTLRSATTKSKDIASIAQMLGWKVKQR